MLGRICGGDAAAVAVSQHRYPTPLLLRKPDPVSRPVSLQKCPRLALERHHSCESARGEEVGGGRRANLQLPAKQLNDDAQ
eukprot:scaffold103385_cov66-Phaeocystis_antarctica.AAC.4